ncbi:MAG: TauD/TfdA family dioxygenase [Pseudomonadota bacterium]
MQLYPPSHYDDKVNGYTLIKTLPLSSAMGAEIQGVDIPNMNDAQLAQVKSALYRYKMVYFRDQKMTIEDQEKLTLRFGTFGTDAYTKGMPGHPNVQHLLKEASTVVDRVFGEGWHTDSPFLAMPPAVSMLYGKTIPPWGGDTWWCNTEVAYDFLSDGMKKLIAGLRVHMSAREAIRLTVRKDDSGKESVGDMQMVMKEQEEMIKGNFHPLVRTHPETGKKALYVDTIYSQGIQGLKDEEARPLLDYLAKHVAREEFACRLRWSPGTFVMWDNRICVHKAFNDYDGYKREMFRTIVNGEVPV